MSKPECIDCAVLPHSSGALAHPDQPWRPRTPRPIDPRSGPRRPRCTTHYRAHTKAGKQRASDKRSRARSGVDEETRQEVLAEQGYMCGGCGASKQRTRLNFDADHIHELARLHDHPDEVACLACLAGYLCRTCNRDLIGHVAQRGARGGVVRTREETAEIFERIAHYLRHPPAARVHARRFAAPGSRKEGQ